MKIPKQLKFEGHVFDVLRVDELSFKDQKTGKIYSDVAVKKYLCEDCKGYGYVSGGVDISGESTSFKCLKCKGIGLQRCRDGN